MHTLVSGRTLLIIGQSISRVFVLQFGTRNHDLLRTFVFQKRASYDVTIPGRGSQIHWQMPIDTTKLQAKIQVDSINITMFFYAICNIEK